MATSGGGNADDAASPKKKQRIGSNTSVSSSLAPTDFSDSTLIDTPHRPPSIGTHKSQIRFNDSATADVILTLRFDCADASSESSSCAAPNQPETQIHLHSRVLRRSKYFAALLSDRRSNTSPNCCANSPIIDRFSLAVPPNANSVGDYLTVLKLLYSDDDMVLSLDSVATALNVLPIALELLFEDCIRACVRFLEAVPWSEDEEEKILSLVPLMSEEESKELISRVSPLRKDSSEEMMQGLILSAIHNHPNMAFAKAFVAKLMRDFSSRETARRVLDKAFLKSLRVVKQSLEEYSSPDFRGDHNETEAIQRLNLHTAMTNGKHLLWLVERMIELRVADTAVSAWSEQASLTADLQRAFRDDAWKNFVPSLPSVVLRCTCRLANAVVTGNILAARQVRMKLVRDWLPVLITCKDRVSIIGHNNNSLYLELEQTFLRIISTLPISDAQELLQQCLSFSTRNIDDCPHLVAAFTTWFRRANGPPQPDLNE